MEESHVGSVEPRRQRTPRASTIYDVARLAGVSHQTVSRLIHGEDRIKPQNRDRILRAIQELGYQPNLAARSLATHRPHRIALLTQEIAQVGPARMLQGANEAAHQAGYLLDITTLDMTDRRTILDTIAIVSGSNTAGILALASTDHVLEALDRAAFRLPAVIGAEEDERDVAHPEQVNQRGMNQIVDHLVQLGHRRFFHIGGPHSWVVARNRAQAFERALTRHGLAPAGVAHGDWSAASGHAAVQAMPADLNVTAVVAANDQMAVGAIYGLKEMGKRVPQHVSVTGFDDIPEARYLHPPLTTVRIDLGAQGAVAFERLLARMEGTDAPVRESTADFMRRASTAEAATL